LVSIAELCIWSRFSCGFICQICCAWHRFFLHFCNVSDLLIFDLLMAYRRKLLTGLDLAEIGMKLKVLSTLKKWQERLVFVEKSNV